MCKEILPKSFKNFDNGSLNHPNQVVLDNCLHASKSGICDDEVSEISLILEESVIINDNCSISQSHNATGQSKTGWGS